MTNPFEDPDTNYTVLLNSAGEYSIWPASIPVPSGWRTVHGPDERDSCLRFVREEWRDLRPCTAAHGRSA